MRPWSKKPLIVVLLALLCGLLAMAPPVSADAPAAGTSIGNQATATYTDASGATRSVTSNVVSTVVQQVASLTLTANNTVTAAVGNMVSLPHVLTNTGNGADTFVLNLTQSTVDGFDLSSVSIYYDVNGNGVVDPGDTLISNGGTTPSVPAGGAISLVIQGTVPPTASGSAGLTLDATSSTDGTKSASNLDTVNVTANAVVSLSKAVSAPSGAPGSGPYTYTLAYTNTGNSDAANVVITDVIPTGLTYVAGSGRWSVSGATALSDALSSDPAGISYDFNITAATRVTATIASVPKNSSGFITFQFTVDAGTTSGTIYNQASYAFEDQPTGGSVINNTSNQVPFYVRPAAAVDIQAPAPVAAASQGAEVTFNNVVTNNGNKSDTFDITVGASTYPAGTTFVLLRSDGVSPLLDTDRSGNPDTGLLAPGGTYTVVLKAILPASASGGGPYSVSKTATSAVDPTVTDVCQDVLTTITTSTVDLKNDPTTLGQGAGPEISPVTTKTVNPGASVDFDLYVENTSSATDSFTLRASTDSTFATEVLPTGWSISFLNDQGTVVTNTAPITVGSTQHITARVTVPAGALAGNSEIYFRVASPNTGAADVKHDRVTVNTIRNIAITPNSTGQVYPGGSVVYPATIRNIGNVLEGDGVVSTVTLGLVDTQATFTSVVYWDRNNDGILDPNDPIITSLAQMVSGTNGASTAAGLDPGEGAVIFVKVYASTGATPGTVDTATLTATTANGSYTTTAPAAATATDTTTVISGNLILEKYQSLETNPAFTTVPTWVTTNLTSGAVPGAFIRYRLVVTNNGTADATSVLITDNTPQYTTYSQGDNTTAPTGNAVMTLDGVTFTAITHPLNGATGTITANVGTLTPGQSATIYFNVRITP